MTNHRFNHLYTLAEAAVVSGHVTPSERQLLFFLDDAFDQGLTFSAGLVLLRQENGTHRVMAGSRQFKSGRGSLFAQKGVGYLQQDAGTVTRQRISANRPAMGQVLQNLQTLAHNRMTLRTFDMGNEAYPAGIVLVTGIVQALFFWECPVSHRQPLQETEFKGLCAVKRAQHRAAQAVWWKTLW
jgi:hypothetical protein